jgi:hypothetical protein
MVVGKRGEKRLIKGMEREQQRDRAAPTLGQYLGGGGGRDGAGGGNQRGGPELGARQRDTYQQRLLPPIERNDAYTQVQHQRQQQQQYNSNSGTNISQQYNGVNCNPVQHQQQQYNGNQQNHFNGYNNSTYSNNAYSNTYSNNYSNNTAHA